VTGDSGPGAHLGPFEGQVVAVGRLFGYEFKIMDKIPVISLPVGSTSST
jgi:hypothetical protein